MDVTVINENTVEVNIGAQAPVVVEVDQGKAGRGIASVTYEPDGTVYYLEITYTDGTTELVGPIPVDEPATLVNYYIKASAAITKGDLVMFSGAVGASGVLQGAPASAGLAEGLLVMGIASESMALNGFGYVTSFGLVQGINTTGSAVGETWATGDILYYNPAYVGKLTKVRPTSPAEVVVVAAVTNANAGNGSLFVRVSFYPKLTELSDVYAVSPANLDLIQWSSANNRWQKTTNLVTGGTISETVNSVVYPVASQYDIGTDPNQIPLNQYLGNLAYQDAGSIAGNVVIGGTVTSAGITSTGPSVISVNSTSNALRITQTGTGNALVVEDSTNPDSSPFVVDASGNLGIGTTSPGGKLDVNGDAYFGSTSFGYSVYSRSTNNWNYANLSLIRNSTNTATPRFLSMMLDGDSTSSTTIGGYNAIWGAYDSSPTTGSTSAALNGAMVYGAYAGHRWYTNGTERLRIASDGNVTFKNAITETVYTLGTSGSIALNPANGTIQTCAAAGNITFTDSLSAGQSLTLMLTGGASYTITWPTTTWVTASGNAAPTLTAADTVVFWKVSTTLYAAYVGSYV